MRRSVYLVCWSGVSGGWGVGTQWGRGAAKGVSFLPEVSSSGWGGGMSGPGKAEEEVGAGWALTGAGGGGEGSAGPASAVVMMGYGRCN